MITTSRRQLQIREEMWEGSPSAKLRAYEHDCMEAGGRATQDAKAEKRHIRLSLGDEWAQGHEIHRFERYSK